VSIYIYVCVCVCVCVRHSVCMCVHALGLGRRARHPFRSSMSLVCMYVRTCCVTYALEQK